MLVALCVRYHHFTAFRLFDSAHKRNGFIFEVLKRTHYSLQDLDAFSFQCRSTRNKGKLPRDFFQQRYHAPSKANRGPHISAYAKDTMLAIQVLGLFATNVLLPEGVLQEHCDAILALNILTDLLLSGDYAVKHTAKVRAATEEHHKQYLRLYPHMEKPKLHYAMHVWKCMSDHAVNLSCVQGERLLKMPKSRARTAFNKYDLTLTRHALDLFLGNLMKEDTFSEYHLEGRSKCLTFNGPLCHNGQDIISAFSSTSAATGNDSPCLTPMT